MFARGVLWRMVMLAVENLSEVWSLRITLSRFAVSEFFCFDVFLLLDGECQHFCFRVSEIPTLIWVSERGSVLRCGECTIEEISFKEQIVEV